MVHQLTNAVCKKKNKSTWSSKHTVLSTTLRHHLSEPQCFASIPISTVELMKLAKFENGPLYLSHFIADSTDLVAIRRSAYDSEANISLLSCTLL